MDEWDQGAAPCIPFFVLSLFHVRVAKLPAAQSLKWCGCAGKDGYGRIKESKKKKNYEKETKRKRMTGSYDAVVPLEVRKRKKRWRIGKDWGDKDRTFRQKKQKKRRRPWFFVSGKTESVLFLDLREDLRESSWSQGATRGLAKGGKGEFGFLKERRGSRMDREE